MWCFTSDTIMHFIKNVYALLYAFYGIFIYKSLTNNILYYLLLEPLDPRQTTSERRKTASSI